MQRVCNIGLNFLPKSRIDKLYWFKIHRVVTNFKLITFIGKAPIFCKMAARITTCYSDASGVSWGVHSVRLHPGGSKRGAKKEGRKRKKQGKGEKKRERKGAPKKERREGKENMQKKRKRGKKSKENGI